MNPKILHKHSWKHHPSCLLTNPSAHSNLLPLNFPHHRRFPLHLHLHLISLHATPCSPPVSPSPCGPRCPRCSATHSPVAAFRIRRLPSGCARPRPPFSWYSSWYSSCARCAYRRNAVANLPTSTTFTGLSISPPRSRSPRPARAGPPSDPHLILLDPRM